MRDDDTGLTGLVRALAGGPRMPGLTPLNGTRDESNHRTSKIIQTLLDSLRHELSPPRR